MSDKSVPEVLGKGEEWRIKNTVIDIYPIRLKDWPDASKLLYLLSFESLADIAYINSIDAFVTLIHIAARYEEQESKTQFDAILEITDSDYKWIRSLISAQNDVDLDRLAERVNKIAGERKNIAAPSSL